MSKGTGKLGARATAFVMSVMLVLGLLPASAIAEASSKLEGSLQLAATEAESAKTTNESGLEQDKAKSPAFVGEKTIDGVTVSTRADAGVLPAGAELSVENAAAGQQAQADAAMDATRGESQNVTAPRSSTSPAEPAPTTRAAQAPEASRDGRPRPAPAPPQRVVARHR